MHLHGVEKSAIAKPLTILIIGDIVGSPGREAVARYVPLAREQHGVDVCIANGENAAAGFGMTEATANEIFAAGVDFITGGNHSFDKREFKTYLEASDRVIRPANYPKSAPGRGYGMVTADGLNVGVVNLMGRVFMTPLDDPFTVGRAAVDELRERTNIIVVDVHAEATSEKIALARFFDGSVSIVFGTHTHVQTSDEQILPGGTAYLTDVGMTGPTDGVIGMETEAVLTRFTTGISERFSVVRSGAIRFNALLVTVDRDTGKALTVKRIVYDGRTA